MLQLTILDIFTLIISLFAICISVWSAIDRRRYSLKISRSSLEATLHKDIYFKYLSEIIPHARENITYNKNILGGFDCLINALNDMRRASLFYKYGDKLFYDNLCNKLQYIEDYLTVEYEGEITHDRFSSFNSRLTDDLEDVYKIIMEKYLGGLD